MSSHGLKKYNEFIIMINTEYYFTKTSSGVTIIILSLPIILASEDAFVDSSSSSLIKLVMSLISSLIANEKVNNV